MRESQKHTDPDSGCWASSGYSVQGCAQFEQKLRQCMDTPVSANTLSNISKANISAEECKPEEKQHQLPSFADVSEDYRTAQARLVLPESSLTLRTLYVKYMDFREEHRGFGILGVATVFDSIFKGVLGQYHCIFTKLGRAACQSSRLVFHIVKNLTFHVHTFIACFGTKFTYFSYF
jgi:hypothetical protein